MLALTAVIVLVGVAVMLLFAGNQLEQRLDERVDQVSRDFDADVNRMRDDVRRELDARLPPAGAVAPTPTPLATTTPAPEDELVPEETATVEPTTTPGANDAATATPTPIDQP
jgi:hypothetical protein